MIRLEDPIQYEGVPRRPPNVTLFRALGSLLDGTWGVVKGSWGVLVATFTGALEGL